MRTAVDSNILIDVIGQPNAFTERAIDALDAALARGSLIACPVIAGEVASHFASHEILGNTFHAMHLEMQPFDWRDLHSAGEAFANYCRRSRAPRSRILADFLVAAHASIHANALLTRDRGYYRTYFPKLTLLEP